MKGSTLRDAAFVIERQDPFCHCGCETAPLFNWYHPAHLENLRDVELHEQTGTNENPGRNGPFVFDRVGRCRECGDSCDYAVLVVVPYGDATAAADLRASMPGTFDAPVTAEGGSE